MYVSAFSTFSVSWADLIQVGQSGIEDLYKKSDTFCLGWQSDSKRISQQSNIGILALHFDNQQRDRLQEGRDTTSCQGSPDSVQ